LNKTDTADLSGLMVTLKFDASNRDMSALSI
jgi:hypothetical protein